MFRYYVYNMNFIYYFEFINTIFVGMYVRSVVFAADHDEEEKARQFAAEAKRVADAD